MPPLQPPPSFDWEEDWAPWVLDNGVPELPPSLEVGQIVPVARWAGPRFGAVVSIWWRLPDDEDIAMGDADAFIDSEVELFHRTDDGWEQASGSGGSSWPEPPFLRPVRDRRAALIGGETSSGGDGWFCTALEGFVGEDVRLIEVEDADGVTSRDVESPFGAVVVAVDGRAPATLTFRDDRGEAVARRQFQGHPDWV